ncbi:MAG: MSHA biogenesis protein MshP [Aeromonas sp.]|uniref:MSHA biogenesis protein MshP n=1 Tax=Aeromonas sp. TaxID=647 RepID=UPI002FCAC6D7
MSPDRMQSKRAGGSALMIALFVIVVMALLAAAMGRFLVDSGEKNTVEVHSMRSLLAAQSGLEIALYQLFPNRSLGQPVPSPACHATRVLNFANTPGLTNCRAEIRCLMVPVTYNGAVTNGYRIESVGTCGSSELDSANPDFAVSRTLMVEAYDGETP